MTDGPRRRLAGRLSSGQARLLDDAMGGQGPAAGGLTDIEHVVILMQENRSFDHYFGTLSGVRGFADPAVLSQTVAGQRYPVFDQFGYEPGVGATAAGYLQPFHLVSDPPLENGQTTNDIAHDWGTQHRSWATGAMDAFITAHLMAMSGSIDPAGTHGAPVVQTFTDRLAEYGKLSWETMPERLLAAGVSWKVYNDPLGLVALSPLPYFKAYNDPLSITGVELISRALSPTYPGTFASDIAAGTLPAAADGIAGPVGLGFRTPALAQPPDSTVPTLPATSLGETSVAEQAVLNALAGSLDVGIPYPLPKANAMPAQETSPARPPVP